MTRGLVPWESRLTRHFDRLQDEMSTLFHRFFGEEPKAWSNGGYTPLTNVAETETAFEVTAELPGVKAEDLHVELRDGSLVISGKKSEEKEEQDKTYHRVERYSGEFCRMIALPPTVDEERIEASFKDGVLKLTVPKTEAAKPKAISIKTD
jgi:HSP20 family protein